MGTKLTGLTEISIPDLADYLYVVNNTPTSKKVSAARLFGQGFRGICGFRLTTESGVPVSPSDRSAQGTIYLTPDPSHPLPGVITVFDGTRWRYFQGSEISYTVTGLTSGLPYDMFVDYNSGTPILAATAWTSGTARATALALQNSVYVKTGATSLFHVGTFYTSATNTTEDSAVKRYLWNRWNQVVRYSGKNDATGHIYSTASYQYWNNDSTNKIEFVLGHVVGEFSSCAFQLTCDGDSTNTFPAVAASLDTISSANIGLLYYVNGNSLVTERMEQVGFFPTSGMAIGYHYAAILENALTGTPTQYNSAAIALLIPM